MELFTLLIPKISLQEIVYTMDSKSNDVNYHVEILEGSIIERYLIFLAAHSGDGRASYFNDLVYLEKGDIILLKSTEMKLIYVVEEKFYIEKNGSFLAKYNNSGNTLFLITCSLRYVNRQLVIKAELVS